MSQWNRPFEVFYDGECSLCSKEINMLRRMDRRGRLRFTDIAKPEFKAEEHGLTHQQFMDEIRGRVEGQALVTGVEVFRQLYGRVGFQWVLPLTRLWGLRHLLDWGYSIFAKNRLKLTGRCKPGEACAIRPPAEVGRG